MTWPSFKSSFFLQGHQSASKLFRLMLLSVPLAAAAACSQTGQMDIAPMSLQPARQTGESSICSVDPTNHVLVVDKRGDYRPVAIHCETGDVLYQVRPNQVRPMPVGEDGCARIELHPALITESQINNYSALECQIDRIINALTEQMKKQPQHIMIFIHGGLNTPEDSLKNALNDLRLILKERPDNVLMKGQAIFPIFLNWPSGGLDSYEDYIVNYKQGAYGGEVRHLESPLYLGNDIAQTGAHVPLDLVKSLDRFVTASAMNDEPEGCDLGSHFGCNEIGKWREPPLTGSIYAATSPLRLITVPMLDVGTNAWKNMVARTRFGVEKYVDREEFDKLFLAKQDVAQTSADFDDLEKQQRILVRGGFYLLFKRLQETFYSKGDVCQGPRITVIGHSMGSMVANEILRDFPDLPFENIVYMAAASSIRDFKAAVEPILRSPKCPDLRFYNLSLHQYWDAREIELHGAAPMGSLLEWIDNIFESPITPIDRTLGKWDNVVYAEDQFDPVAMDRMFFHRFGLSAPDPLMHGEFTQIPQDSNLGCPAIPYWNPSFWSEVRRGTEKSCQVDKLSLQDIGVSNLPKKAPKAN